jgi:hypothetical protein
MQTRGDNECGEHTSVYTYLHAGQFMIGAVVFEPCKVFWGSHEVNESDVFRNQAEQVLTEAN